MKRSGCLAIILFLAALIAVGVFVFRSRTSVIGRSLNPLPYAGAYRGIVLDADTGAPLYGAEVAAEWWCHDIFIPDVGGNWFARSSTRTDATGGFYLESPETRGGWFGSSFSLKVSAPGYIDDVWLLDPSGRPLPPSTAAWPFRRTHVEKALPAEIRVRLAPELPVILKSLKSKEPLILSTAAEMLEKYGPEAAAGVPDLAAGLSSPEANARRACARTLGKIGPEASAAVPELMLLLSDGSEWAAYEAALALGRIGAKPRLVVPELVNALSSPHKMTRRGAAEALGMFGSQAESALPVLEEATHDEVSGVREDAKRSIKAIKKQAGH